MASSGIQAFGAKLDAFGDALAADVPSLIVAETAAAYTVSIKTSIAGATTGNRLRGVGKRGASVGTKTLISGRTALIQATGPLHLLENDTSEHTIPRTVSSRRLRTPAGRLSRTRVSTGRSLSGNSLLVINGNVITGPVTHPGTRGKHPFAKGVEAGAPAAEAASLSVFGTALRSVFNG